MGLDMMARAGIDPRQSVELWRNMAKESANQTPEFLSTHPSNRTRIRDLGERIPSAMRLYQDAQARGRRPACS